MTSNFDCDLLVPTHSHGIRRCLIFQNYILVAHPTLCEAASALEVELTQLLDKLHQDNRADGRTRS